LFLFKVFNASWAAMNAGTALSKSASHERCFSATSRAIAATLSYNNNSINPLSGSTLPLTSKIVWRLKIMKLFSELCTVIYYNTW
jgi:hypothetical protein